MSARKPEFFQMSQPMYEVVTGEGLMRPCFKARPGNLCCMHLAFPLVMSDQNHYTEVNNLKVLSHYFIKACMTCTLMLTASCSIAGQLSTYLRIFFYCCWRCNNQIQIKTIVHCMDGMDKKCYYSFGHHIFLLFRVSVFSSKV